MRNSWSWLSLALYFPFALSCWYIHSAGGCNCYWLSHWWHQSFELLPLSQQLAKTRKKSKQMQPWRIWCIVNLLIASHYRQSVNFKYSTHAQVSGTNAASLVCQPVIKDSAAAAFPRDTSLSADSYLHTCPSPAANSSLFITPTFPASPVQLRFHTRTHTY